MDTVIRSFVKRKGLKAKYPNLKIARTKYRKCIYIDEPSLLYRFAAEIKHKLGNPINSSNIYFRGQTEDHSQFSPSIFRKINGSKNNFKKRHDAHKEFTSGLYSITHQARFRKEIGGAILQHYGIRTPWLDLVDNIFAAIWFAAMERSESEPYFFNRSNQEFGYIYFIQVESPSNSFNKEIVEGQFSKWCDLRRTTNSLSLRPHNQGGIFFTKKEITETNSDLSEFIRVIVKFPIKKWAQFLKNLERLYTMEYMFPNTKIDHTYKSLGSSKITEYLRKIEIKYELIENELGNIDRYK